MSGHDSGELMASFARQVSENRCVEHDRAQAGWHASEQWLNTVDQISAQNLHTVFSSDTDRVIEAIRSLNVLRPNERSQPIHVFCSANVKRIEVNARTPTHF